MGMCCHTEFANAVRLLTGHFSTGWQVHHAQFGHGKFDHLGIDPKGGRLFVAAESAHQVLVFGLKSGKYLRSIDEIEIPHAIFVREDLNRIFITDGGSGALKVYDAASYALLKSIPLKVGADSIGYDPATRFLYIDNGGSRRQGSVRSRRKEWTVGLGTRTLFCDRASRRLGPRRRVCIRTPVRGSFEQS
jgi:hypothetical protein